MSKGNEPDFNRAIEYALSRLRRELAETLTYHNLWHTEEDVILGCMRLGQHIGIEVEEMRLLEVAAAFHDLGFTESYANHELVGARIAAQQLPVFGFKPRDIERVMGMILATRLPQSPRNLLEQILADADLDTLGRQDFWHRNEELRREWSNYGREINRRQWYEGQIAFLRNHRYFTPAARMLRNEGKRRNLQKVEAFLRAL